MSNRKQRFHMMACLMLVIVAGSLDLAAQGPNGKVPEKCGVGQTIVFDGNAWVCSDVKATKAPKVYDSTGTLVGSWVGYPLVAGLTPDGNPPFSYVLLDFPGADGVAIVASNQGTLEPILGPIDQIFIARYFSVYFTGVSCDGTAYVSAGGGPLIPATPLKTGSPLKTELWAPKTGGAKLSEGSPFQNPSSPIRSVMRNRADPLMIIPSTPAVCSAVNMTSTVGTGRFAEAIMIVPDVEAAWIGPFRIGN